MTTSQRPLAVRHIKVDDEIWRKLHLLKLYLKKRSINELLRQILKEWEETKGIKLGLKVER